MVKIKNALFFGLPGNPVSAAVTFQIFIIPAIRENITDASTLQS